MASGAGGSGTVAPPRDLTGVWDLVMITGSEPFTTKTIEVSKQSLTIRTRDELIMDRTPTGFDGTYSGKPVRAAVSAAGSLDLGIIPLPLSGAWYLENIPDDGPYCTYRLESGRFRGHCSPDAGKLRHLPDLADASVTAEQYRVVQSVFGALGGSWELTLRDGAGCVVELLGSAIRIFCNDTRGFDGTVNLVLEGESLSGQTSGGIEFTAQRR